jgi:hypothetical protein
VSRWRRDVLPDLGLVGLGNRWLCGVLLKSTEGCPNVKMRQATDTAESGRYSRCVTSRIVAALRDVIALCKPSSTQGLDMPWNDPEIDVGQSKL